MADMLLTVTEVATLLQLDVETVYDLVQQHQLRGMKVRGQWRFVDLDVRRWLDTHGESPQKPVSPTL
jgi:excisionase family DNA binding protein